MESLSRPPHRRKHSTTTNASSSSSFSLKNPYDNVLLSKGSKAKFKAHEYAEIFSGLSSIPVLDVSGLSERVGPGDFRSSNIDYSNIFGGLMRDDDVALPYEQLFNGALKKTKTRIPADMEPPILEPVSKSSSGKIKRSSGVSDQSIDGIKQHFNMSFNKTIQRNRDESNGKIHIAQLHAVPGFTHFVDGTPLQKKETERPVPAVRREVSRTWSFNSGVEATTVKGEATSENSHKADKSCNVNGVNQNSHVSKVPPPPSSHPHTPNDNKDLRRSRLPSFACKDASEKTVGGSSPPLLDEELDENSVAAVSAAALKKAIEQAQESIRIAKMIMEKKKEGLNNGSRPRSKGWLKVKDRKETRIDHVPDASKENTDGETYEEPDPTFPVFTGVDGKFIPSLSHCDNIFSAGEAKVEMARGNVQAANEHGEAFTEVGKKFTQSCSQSEIVNTNEKVEVENFRQNVEAAEACGETTNESCGSRPKSKGCLKVKGKKETRSAHVPDALKENTARETCEKLDPTVPMFTGVDGKFMSSLSHGNNFLNAGMAKVEMVSENVQATNENGVAFTKVGKKFAQSCSESEILNTDEMVEMENVRVYVDAAEASGETTNCTGLAAYAKCGILILESERVDNNHYSMCSTDQVATCLEQIETGKVIMEQRGLTIHQSEGLEVVPERAGSTPNISQSAQGLNKSVDESLQQFQATVDDIEGPENVAEQLERFPNYSGSTQEQEKIMHEGGGNLRISQEAELIEDSDSNADDKGKCAKIFVGHEELVCVEHLRVFMLGYNNLLSESQNLAGKDVLEQADMDKKSENVSKWKENDQLGKSNSEEENGMVLKEEYQWFESETQLMEPVEKEIMEREPEIFQEVKENGTKENVIHEPEIVEKKLNYEHEQDGQKLQGDHGQNDTSDRQMDTSKCEAVETIQMERNNYPEVHKRGVPSTIEEMNDTYGGAGRSEENQDKFDFEMAASGKDIDEAFDAHCNDSNNYSEVLKNGAPSDIEEKDGTFWRAQRSEEIQDKFEYQEAASEKDIDEAVDAQCNDSGTFYRNSHGDNTSTIFSEIEEPCEVDSNNTAEKYQATVRGCKANDSLPLETETFLAVGDDEAGKLINLEVKKLPVTESLRRCASEEKFVESHPNDTFIGFSSNGKSHNVDLMDADPEEPLATDEEIFETASEIRDTAQEYAIGINLQNLPEFHSTNNKAMEFDNTNVEPVLGQTFESNKEHVLTSILENIDVVSTHESQACKENAKDNNSNKEEIKDGPHVTSDESESVVKQVEQLQCEDRSAEFSSQSNCESGEMDKSVEAERNVETGQDMEKNKEKPSRTSTMGQRDAKGTEQKFEIDDHKQRIEAIRKGREREKDRIAVERVIREARERAFAEARERAERAAVERAAAEARQRVMAEEREKHEKAPIENKRPTDKASSNEAKLRVERAAVERATAEARERALEKAMSQKTFAEARTQVDKYSFERFSSSSRNNGLKHSLSSSDLEKFDGATSESAQRRKARLERHQRIMERAAKALDEKNMRDILAQKEQAERNRLAESLDADIKRWAAGKEGNLRALLSTLQYILGPDSGWQPVSLTEIITATAVKKAYRKATLCVHPDKLQQRGASIQQKYICEKVFDLLKAAWNRFNSEER